MNEQKKQFAEELLACDKSSSKARESYEKELRAMLDTKLTAYTKREWLIAAILCALLVPLVTYGGVEVFRAHTPEFICLRSSPRICFSPPRLCWGS
jgi:hypothetical protein